FRSEYIIHFYGACVIPNHICMVTEFAQYGSLQDLFNNIPKGSDKELTLKMKMKVVLDATRGILYLHENGILHRDIKPDNILILSLEKDIITNGKLTDFGSSRNINLLMTNMTFTRGVGTPKYMAPEILNKQHYKKAADIYSLAVTFFETLIWGEAYPLKLFPFPWNVADYIASGRRRELQSNMNEEAYDIINDMWVQKPEERMTAMEVVKSIEAIYNKI
ncbi:tyrosine kinase, putative, partial [Entamoeba invadens IP1]